ncbi:hypothetical protein LTR70_000829 [Exophiala xenobiotica]|uniref:Uncharacterized protein n=1 Tax=Lithohypha guttulata TaxID=1690604 RepID=A0ABR0KP53_9EURO|nr:hypothetical protein LTR24_000498 [Lithohypha guttulata]KAK5329332.1 hypothetical protein LTR70_000829 [Exophiala xenobiotica]
MAHNLQTKGKGNTRASTQSRKAPMTVSNEMNTNVGSAMGSPTNMNTPVSSVSGSSLSSDFYAWKAQIEELADDDYSQERTAEQVIEELGDYSAFMQRWLDRRQHDSESMMLVLPYNIQAELGVARDDLEAAWTGRIMDCLSEKAATLVAKSNSGPRSIGFENEFSKLGRQITHACGTIRVYNADIDHEQWQRFVPRCVNHNVHAIIHRLLKAHKQFQASLYLSNDKEHVRLWYLIWHNLCKNFKLLQRNEDRLPSADYCIESSFFRTKEIRELFEFSAHQADFFIPREIENIVGYYCEIINDHHSQTKPKSGHLRGLSEKKPLSAKAISTLTEFPENDRWDPAALKALHWATIRMNYLTGGPMVFRRNGAITGARSLDGPEDQLVLEQLDTREGVDADDLAYGSSWLQDDLTTAERVSEAPAVDIDDIFEDNFVTTASTALTSASNAPNEASSLVGTDSSARGPQTLPEQPVELVFECCHSPIGPHGLAAASPYVSAQAFSTSSPYTSLKSGASRKVSVYNGLPTPQSLPFSSPANYKDVMGDHHRTGEDIESQDSVSMDISPTSDDIPQAVNSAATATGATVQWPVGDEDVLMTSEHDALGADDLPTFQRPELRGQNHVSAYDYVYCPFPENRKYEAANSRLISRDLRDPGIVSDGLRTQDLVNLPPLHCRTPGKFATWKKRTPSGPYEVFRMLGSAVVRKTVGRKGTPIIRPRFPPCLTSRASCQHYKHVLAAKRDPQARVTRPSERRMPILRGGGVRDGRRLLRRSPGQPTAGLRERAPDSPTPAGPRQPIQRHARPMTSTNGLQSRSRSPSSSRVSFVDLTRDDHPAVTGEPEEDNGDDLGSGDHFASDQIHEDSPVNGPAGIPNSLGGSSNKENVEQGPSSGPRRPLRVNRAGNMPVTSGSTPLWSTSSEASSPPNTPDLGLWLRCHPCPVYPDQYHHQCCGQHCAGLSPRRQSTITSPSSGEPRVWVSPRPRPLEDDGQQSPPSARFRRGPAPRWRDSAFFHSSLYVYLLQDGDRSRLPFPPRLSQMCADDIPDDSIYAVEDGILYVLRTGPDGVRALTRLTDSDPPTQDYWHLRHASAVWQVLQGDEHTISSQITPERLIDHRAAGFERGFLDERGVGRMYQLVTGDIVRINWVAGSVRLEMLQAEQQNQSAIPSNQVLHPSGPTHNAAATRGPRPLGGDDAAPQGLPAQGVHHDQVLGNQSALQDGNPSRRDFDAQSPQDTAQETLDALPGGPQMNALHERLRVQRANTKRGRSIDRLRDNLLARADDIDRLLINPNADSIPASGEPELLRNEATNLWPTLRQATDLGTWQAILDAARARLSIVNHIIHADSPPNGTGDDDKDEDEDSDHADNLGPSHLGDVAREDGPANGDEAATRPSGNYGQPPAQHLAHIAHQGLEAMNEVSPSIENDIGQNNNYEAEKGPAHCVSHHEEETDEEVYEQPDDDLQAINDLLEIAEGNIETLNSLVLQWGALHDVDLSGGRSTEERLPESVAEWVTRVHDVGNALNDAGEADDQMALVRALHDARQVVEALGMAIENITGYDPNLSSNQLWGLIRGREAGLSVEHEELLDAIPGFVRVPFHVRDALQAAEDALQAIRALTDDTTRIRLQRVVEIADQALADMDRAKESYQQNENTSDSDGSEDSDQTQDDDMDAGDQLQDDLDHTTNFMYKPEAEQVPANRLSSSSSSSSESSSGDDTESDTAPFQAQADSPKGRGVARKASAAARQRHAAIQSARQAATRPESRAPEEPIATPEDAAAKARLRKRITGKKGKKPQKKGAHESDIEDPKTKKGKRKDDDSDDDQSGGNVAQPARRSTRVAAKATAQTGAVTQSTTNKSAAKSGPKSGSKGGKKRAAAEDDEAQSAVAHYDSESNSSARIPPRKKSKHVAFASEPAAVTTNTNTNTDDSVPGQDQRQRKSSLADQKLDELRNAARSRLQAVFARHGLELYGGGGKADVDVGRAIDGVGRLRRRRPPFGLWLWYSSATIAAVGIL